MEKLQLLSEIDDEGACSQQQVSVWMKTTPSRTFITREKLMPDFKGQIALLLQSNTASNFNLNPVPIYHSENSKNS